MWPSSPSFTSSLTTLHCSNMNHGGHHHLHCEHAGPAIPEAVLLPCQPAQQHSEEFENLASEQHFTQHNTFYSFSCAHPHQFVDCESGCAWAPQAASTPLEQDGASFPVEAWETESRAPSKVHEIYSEIVEECEHLLRKSDCHSCRQRSLFLSTSTPFRPPHPKLGSNETLKEASFTKECPEQILVKKRQQNKQAAARYRDKQKDKWIKLLEEEKKEKEKNKILREKVSRLEAQVSDYKRRLEDCIRKNV